MPPVNAPLTPLGHLIVLLLCAGLYGFAVSRALRPSLSWRLAVIVVLVLAPMTALVVLGPAERWLSGTEGVFEAMTEGLLLGMAVYAVKRRQGWMVLGATLLFLEEVNYGFLFIESWRPDLSPGVPSWLGSRSGHFNFHNSIYLDWLWKPLPLLMVVLLSVERLPSRLRRVMAWLRLPLLRRYAWLLVLVALAGFVINRELAGFRRADEAFELALVMSVALSWPKSMQREGNGAEQSQAHA